MKTERAVIFDMDGVLVDNAEYHRKAWIEFSRKKGHPITLEEFETIGFGDVNKRYLEFVFKRVIEGDELTTLANEKEQLYRTLFTQHIKSPKGLVELLEILKSNGFKTAIGTSAPRENLDFVLDALKIRNYFDAFVDDSFVEKGKPNPEVYLKVAELLDVKPPHCVVIEDAYHGIAAAHNAGMKCIGLPTTYPAKQIASADYVAEDFTDITIEKVNELLNT